MLAFRFHQTLFTHVIAANCRADALRIAANTNQFGTYTVDQWHTPDIWTRRSVDAATVPGIIDTIPRFVVDTDDGPVYVDIDDISSAHNHKHSSKWRKDSDVHALWLDACNIEYSRGDLALMREHVASIATERDVERYATMTRALAGAWGLGPIPEWHAAILPALIALDIELDGTPYATPPNWFELKRDELRLFANANHYKPVYDKTITGKAIIGKVGWRHACALTHLGYMLHWAGRPPKTGPTRIDRLRLGSREILRRLTWLPWENDSASVDNGLSTCEQAP